MQHSRLATSGPPCQATERANERGASRPLELVHARRLPDAVGRGRSAVGLLVRACLVLDLDLAATHGVADDLLALLCGLAHRHFLNNPRLLGDDRPFDGGADLDTALLEALLRLFGAHRPVHCPALDMHFFLTQTDALLDRQLLDARMQADTATAGLALADVQLFLDGLRRLLLCRLTPASPLLGPRLDVDQRLALHDFTGFFGAIVVDPGDNETEAMLNALRIKLGLVLWDSGLYQLADQVLTGLSIAQQARRARAALAGQHAHLMLCDAQVGQLLCSLLRLLGFFINCHYYLRHDCPSSLLTRRQPAVTARKGARCSEHSRAVLVGTVRSRTAASLLRPTQTFGGLSRAGETEACHRVNARCIVDQHVAHILLLQPHQLADAGCPGA